MCDGKVMNMIMRQIADREILVMEKRDLPKRKPKDR